MDASRRAFDMAASAAGLIVLSPMMLVVAAGIKLQDGGRVLFQSPRVGKGGELFYVYKFRTMVPNADKTGPGITMSGDVRITPIGRILRATKLDELPQLLNVLKGDMSIVGPRPEDPRYVAQYTPQQRRILEVRPGITSAASVRYRNEEEMLSGPDWEITYRERILPDKIAIDLDYLQRRTLWSDIRIMFETLAALFR